MSSTFFSFDIDFADKQHKIVLFASSSLAALIVYVVYNLYFHPLAALPGPFIARSGLWSYRVNRAIMRDASYRLDELHTRYGNYVRLGRNQVITVDEDAVQVLYGHASKWEKSKFYHLFRLGPAKGIMSETNTKKHAALRRSSASAYSMNALLELEGSVDSMADEFFKRVDQFADSKQPFDAGLWLQWVAMDL